MLGLFIGNRLYISAGYAGHDLRNHVIACIHRLGVILTHLIIGWHIGRRRCISWELKRASWCRACWGAGVCAAGGGRGVGAVRRQGERGAAGLLERIWKRGVVWHVWFIVAQVPKLNQKAVLWVELVVARH